MKSFINAKGELEQHAENLEDELAIRSPELSAKLDEVKNWKSHFMGFKNFFYQHPIETEIELPIEKRAGWQSLINYIHSQKGLRQVIGAIEFSKHSDRELIGDKVLVIQTNRPIWDTVIKPEGNYKVKGWIGTLKEYTIMDPRNPIYETNQTQITRKLTLSNAIRLTKREIGQWTAEKITNIQFHDFYEGIDAIIKKFAKLPAGEIEITIADSYENIDYEIIHHVKNKNEEEAAKLKSDFRFNISKYYPEYSYGLVASSGTLYDQSNQSTTFIGDDSRDLKEIYDDLTAHLGSSLKQGIQIFVGKRLEAKMSEEERQFVKMQPVHDRDKWLHKFYTEKGLALSGKTAVDIYLKDKMDQSIKIDISLFLHGKGYEPTENFGVGSWGGQPDKYEDYSDIFENRAFIGWTKYF